MKIVSDEYASVEYRLLAKWTKALAGDNGEIDYTSWTSPCSECKRADRCDQYQLSSREGERDGPDLSRINKLVYSGSPDLPLSEGQKRRKKLEREREAQKKHLLCKWEAPSLGWLDFFGAKGLCSADEEIWARDVQTLRSFLVHHKQDEKQDCLPTLVRHFMKRRADRKGPALQEAEFRMDVFPLIPFNMHTRNILDTLGNKDKCGRFGSLFGSAEHSFSGLGRTFSLLEGEHGRESADKMVIRFYLFFRIWQIVQEQLREEKERGEGATVHPLLSALVHRPEATVKSLAMMMDLTLSQRLFSLQDRLRGIDTILSLKFEYEGRPGDHKETFGGSRIKPVLMALLLGVSGLSEAAGATRHDMDRGIAPSRSAVGTVVPTNATRGTPRSMNNVIRDRATDSSPSYDTLHILSSGTYTIDSYNTFVDTMREFGKLGTGFISVDSQKLSIDQTVRTLSVPGLLSFDSKVADEIQRLTSGEFTAAIRGLELLIELSFLEEMKKITDHVVKAKDKACERKFPGTKFRGHIELVRNPSVGRAVAVNFLPFLAEEEEVARNIGHKMHQYGKDLKLRIERVKHEVGIGMEASDKGFLLGANEIVWKYCMQSSGMSANIANRSKCIFELAGQYLLRDVVDKKSPEYAAKIAVYFMGRYIVPELITVLKSIDRKDADVLKVIRQFCYMQREAKMARWARTIMEEDNKAIASLTEADIKNFLGHSLDAIRSSAEKSIDAGTNTKTTPSWQRSKNKLATALADAAFMEVTRDTSELPPSRPIGRRVPLEYFDMHISFAILVACVGMMSHIVGQIRHKYG